MHMSEQYSNDAHTTKLASWVLGVLCVVVTIPIHLCFVAAIGIPIHRVTLWHFFNMTEESTTQQGDLFSLLTTLAVFGLISAGIYYLLLKPILNVGGGGDRQVVQTNNTVAPRNANHNDAARHARRPQPQQATGRAAAVAASTSRRDDDGDSILASLCNDKCPSHVNPNSMRQAGLGGVGILVDGLVPFRHGRAANYATTDQDVVATNRRDRARVMARLLALSSDASASSSPPSRGSTVVVSLQRDNVDCSKLRRVLYLLGTYYNLMVMLNFGDKNDSDDGTLSQEQQNKMDAELLKNTVLKLRGNARDAADNYIPMEVLPDHRVVASRSITGRVAFVRQLARVEVVLDFDPEIKTQLGRFGFRVYIYKQDSKGGLGPMLMP